MPIPKEHLAALALARTNDEYMLEIFKDQELTLKLMAKYFGKNIGKIGYYTAICHSNRFALEVLTTEETRKNAGLSSSADDNIL